MPWHLQTQTVEGQRGSGHETMCFLQEFVTICPIYNTENIYQSTKVSLN